MNYKTLFSGKQSAEHCTKHEDLSSQIHLNHTSAAGDTLIFFFFFFAFSFSDKIRVDILYRWFAWNAKSYFLWKMTFKNWMSSAAILISALRVNSCVYKDIYVAKQSDKLSCCVTMPNINAQYFTQWTDSQLPTNICKQSNFTVPKILVLLYVPSVYRQHDTYENIIHM